MGWAASACFGLWVEETEAGSFLWYSIFGGIRIDIMLCREVLYLDTLSGASDSDTRPIGQVMISYAPAFADPSILLDILRSDEDNPYVSVFKSKPITP